MTGSGVVRGQPLALRLAVPLAIAVVVVLLVSGIIVNRAVDSSYTEELSRTQRARLQLAVTALEEVRSHGLPGGDRALRPFLRRIAQVSGGTVRLLDADGDIVAEAGGGAAADGLRLAEALAASAGGGQLELILPSSEQPFLRVFNTALVLTGIASVLAIVATAWFIAGRLTRPLRGLAGAAQRLGEGELATRAAGGPDRESAALAEAFNAMASRIERSEMLRRRAASDVAHDLATPATVLESQLQAMLDGVVPADRRELERARSAATALSGVVRQLGELAGAEAATLQRRAETVALRPLVDRIVAGLEALLRERSVEVVVEGEADAWSDPGQVERAVRNVVANGIQHAGRRVAISIAREGSSAGLRVDDDGPGIDAIDLPHVFERFYRADRSRGTPGSGIGLTVARELIVANGGTIEVEATGPAGTTFRIAIPGPR